MEGFYEILKLGGGSLRAKIQKQTLLSYMHFIYAKKFYGII